MEYNKKMTRAGGISIPAALRRDYGLQAGDRYNISIGKEGAIVLKPTAGSCMYCQSDKELAIYAGRQICRKCALEVLKAWEA